MIARLRRGTPAAGGSGVGPSPSSDGAQGAHQPVSPPELTEEIAAATLYGERSGTVTVATARPPL